MGDFPEFFYSRAPLPERVSLINLRNGGQYWMLSVANEHQHREKRGVINLAPYDDNDAELLDCCDLEDNYEINPTKSGKFITSFYVPQALHSVIVGSRGSKLRELQDTTNTLIKVPRTNEGAIIKITGHSERAVASARTQIILLALNRREKMSITHFVSIAMNSQEIRVNFLKFQEEVLKGPPTRGIDASIFQNPAKLHITVVTLVLLDEKELEETKQVLIESQKIFDAKRMRIELKGVEIMNDDPTDVDVLYGKVNLNESNERVEQFANEILETFYKNGLVRRQFDKVKLHVTLMNSLFRKSEKEDKKRQSFDASEILQKYKDFYFGTIDLNEIHLSIRFSSGRDGFYESAAKISI